VRARCKRPGKGASGPGEQPAGKQRSGKQALRAPVPPAALARLRSHLSHEPLIGCGVALLQRSYILVAPARCGRQPERRAQAIVRL